MDDQRSIWTKVDFALVKTDESKDKKPSSEEDGPTKRETLSRAIKFFDVLAALLWTYVLLKLFVFDVDRELVELVAPGSDWVVDFRFFLFLGVLAALVLAINKHWLFIALLVYVAMFPLVLLCWKLPRAIYRTKSWVAFFGVVNGFSLVLSNLRYSILFVTLAAYAALAILVTRAEPVLAASALILTALVVMSVVRTVRSSLTASRFLKMQERTIRRVVDSKQLTLLTEVNEDLRRTDIEKFSPAQQDQFLQSLSHGVLMHHGLLFWGHQLAEYRRSPAPLFFNLASYVTLFLTLVGAFSFINLAIFKIDAESYTYEATPSVALFIRYSTSALYGNEINAIQPNSDLTNLISTGAFVLGVGLVLTLIATALFSYRQQRDQAAILATIDQIRREGRKLESRLEEEYEVSVPEAIERLRELRHALLGVITFLSARIPGDFEDRRRPRPPGGSSTPS